MPYYSVEFIDRPAQTLRLLLRELRRLSEKDSEDDGNSNQKPCAHVGAPCPATIYAAFDSAMMSLRSMSRSAAKS